MTGHEDREFTALDAYIRDQLSKAAEVYATHVDVAARLSVVLEATRTNEYDESSDRC